MNFMPASYNHIAWHQISMQNVMGKSTLIIVLHKDSMVAGTQSKLQENYVIGQTLNGMACTKDAFIMILNQKPIL